MKIRMAVLLLFASSFAVASCPANTVEVGGTCAAMPKPADQEVSAKPSDEKVPDDKMPSYEREGIHADMPSSTAAQDAMADEAKVQADAQGKADAGIK